MMGGGVPAPLPWGQEMFTACGFLSVSNLSLLRLSPTAGPHPSHSGIISSWGVEAGYSEGTVTWSTARPSR